MKDLSPSLKKDTIIIILIAVVFLAVFLVFYTEIINNLKIGNSKKNFYFVKQELLKEFNNCKGDERNWVFGISCEHKLTKKMISDYFNKIKKITNPYDNFNGVEGNPGSVQIDIQEKLLVLSVDFDANGGIDIEHKIHLD